MNDDLAVLVIIFCVLVLAWVFEFFARLILGVH